MTSPTSVSKSIPSSEVAAILGVDPGSGKTGLALVAADGRCLERQIVPTDQAVEAAASACARHGLRWIAVGDGTHSRGVVEALGAIEGCAVVRVDERHSTEEARAHYLAENPARGIARFLPRGLRTPPCPVDDFAAWVIARRALAHMNAGPPDA